MRASRFAVLAAPVVLLSPAFAQEAVELPEVVVFSPNRSATEASRVGSAVSVVERADIERTGDQALLGALRRTPGLAVQRNGGEGAVASVSLRGLDSRYIQTRVDGIEIGDPAAPQVTPNLQFFRTGDIGRVEVLRGSQSALYGGEAVAGVIDVTTRRAEAKGIETRLSLEGGSFNTFNGALSVAGGYDRGDFALNAVIFDTQGFSAADENDGNDEADAARNLTLSGAGEVTVAEGFALGGAARFTDAETEFDATFPSLGDGDRTQIGDATTFGARGYARTTLLDGRFVNEIALQRFSSRRDSVSSGFLSEFDGDRIKAEYIGDLAATDRLALTFGGDWTRESAEDNFGFEGDFTIAGAFAQAAFDPIDTLTATVALRYDDHSEFGGYPTGRATFAWRPVSGTKLRASVGTGFRAPSAFELFSSFGDATLEPEESFGWDVGIEQSFLGGRVAASATYFALDVEDRIDFDLAASRYVQTDGETESRGVELTLAARPYDWIDAVAAYAYIDATNEDGSRALRVPRHQASFAVTARPNDRFSITLDGVLVEDLNNDGVNDEDYLVLGAKAEYALTDRAALYVRGENLLDAEYQTVDGYGASDLAVFAGLRARF